MDQSSQKVFYFRFLSIPYGKSISLSSTNAKIFFSPKPKIQICRSSLRTPLSTSLQQHYPDRIWYKLVFFFVFVFVLVACGLWGFEWRLRASGGCGFWWWLGQWWGISMEAIVIPYLLTLHHLALLTFSRSQIGCFEFWLCLF